MEAFMKRARLAFAATIAGVIAAGGLTIAAQGQPAPAAPKAPEFKSVLAGKKFTPPIRGQATIDIVRSPTQRVGTTLVTKIQVKNTSNAPIARLQVVETWYDKTNNIIPGGKGEITGLLQPGEVGSIEVRTPTNPNMNASKLMFTHANGTVDVKAVKAIDAKAGAKEPATKAAAATKATKATKGGKKK
jgi:hypothetical protein